MHRAVLAEQRYRNAEAVRSFYLQVLDAFADQLQKQFRYKSHITDDDIDQFKKLIAKKLDFIREPTINEERFKKYLEMKATGQQRQHLKIKEDASKEEELIKERKEYSEPQTQFQSKMECKVEDKQEQNQGESSEDDLAVYQGPNCIFHFPTSDLPKSSQAQQSNQKQKIQPQLNQEQPVLVKGEHLSPLSDQSDSEESYQLFRQAVEKGIGVAFVGTFSTTKIKRNPKDERISIELRDVFVKYMNVPFENYYPQVQCELIKQERNNLPEKYKK